MTRIQQDIKALLFAAELVASGDYDRSCLAIDAAVGAVKHSALRGRYAASMLAGNENTYALPWKCPVESQEARDVRVLLLCFAAALAETGDLRKSLHKTIVGHPCRKHPLFYGLRYFLHGNRKKVGACVGCADEAGYRRRVTSEWKKEALARVAQWRGSVGAAVVRGMNNQCNARWKKLNRGKYKV